MQEEGRCSWGGAQARLWACYPLLFSKGGPSWGHWGVPDSRGGGTGSSSHLSALDLGWWDSGRGIFACSTLTSSPLGGPQGLQLPVLLWVLGESLTFLRGSPTSLLVLLGPPQSHGG